MQYLLSLPLSLSQVIEVMNIKQKKEKKGGFTLLKGNARDSRFKG